MLSAGTQLGPYKVLQPLGAGGMGEVYRARDLRLDREVAVKVLPEQSAASAQQLARFEREAKAVAALSHPNILAIHDFATEQGIRFAVMELLEGETLRQRIIGAALPWRRALEIGEPIAEGLAAAHAKGIVHRDLKPENVFLTSDGRIKILDFGLARAEPEAAPEVDTGPYVPGLTEQGTVMGTFGYMSPEQLRGEGVDARSDLFSFGCVLYEMLTGRPAFRRQTRAETVAATLHEDPPELSTQVMGAPSGVDRVLRRCLEKNPQKRFQSARDLAFNLRTLLADLGARPEPAFLRLRRGVILSAAAFALLLGAGIALRHAITASKGLSNYGQLERLAGPKRIAVLPIVNETGDKEKDLSDESTELLIGQLQVRGLVVRPFAAVSRYKEDKRGWQELGRNLQVDYVLIGRLRPGDKFSIELLDVAADNLVLGKYSVPITGEVYGNVAREVLARLDVPMTAEETQRLAKPLTGSREALRLYLMGQQEFKQEKRANVEKAIEYYGRAQKLDPSFSLPYQGLAYAYYWQSGILAAPNDVMPKAKAAALRALDREGTLGEAHALLGFIMASYDWEWRIAEERFHRAIDLAPSSMTVHTFYALYLVQLGRFEEGLAELDKYQALDPLSPEIPGYRGLALWFARQHGKAIDELRGALKSNPESVNLHAYLGMNLEQKGGDYHAEAIKEFEQARKLDGGNDDPFTYSQLGHAYALAGQKDEARKLLDKLRQFPKDRHVSSYNFVLIYVGLGEKEEAIGALERAAAEHEDWIACLNVDPRLDSLRGDARFRALQKRAGLGP